jgi:MFS family permease
MYAPTPYLRWLGSAVREPKHRNVFILSLCQALSGSTMIMTVAATSLAAHSILDDKSLSTVPLFVMHLAIMCITVPASFIMKARGRAFGFALGALFSVVGGVISALSMIRQSFPLMCLGGILQGCAQGFAFYYRFAAADAAEPAFRPNAISLVMAGGVLAALIGPEAAKFSKDLLAPVTFAGIYLAISAFSAVTFLLAIQLDIPRPAEEQKRGGRTLREIARQPTFRVAVIVSMAGYATMTLLMTATPLAMHDCVFKFGFSDSANVIQGHVVAMFLPAFFTGALIQRWGAERIIFVGCVVEILSAVTHLAGETYAHFYIGTVLLGAGWNFMYIGGTALLTTTYRPEERAKVQAFNELLVFSSTATAAGLSGFLQARFAWALLNTLALPLLGTVLLALLVLFLVRGRKSAGA